MLLQVSRHCHKHKEPSAGKGTRDISKSIYSCFSFCFWSKWILPVWVLLPCAQGFICLRHLERIARGWSEEAPCSAQWFWQHPSGVCSFCPWQFLYSLASCWKFHNSAMTPHSHSNVFIHWRPQVCLSPGPGKGSTIVGFAATEHTVCD